MTQSFEQLSTLDKFRLEIAELKRKESEAGISVHFRDLTPENLTIEDMNLYNKFRSGTLELSEFRKYRGLVCKEKKDQDSCGLAAYIANQADYWDKKMKDNRGE